MPRTSARRPPPLGKGTHSPLRGADSTALRLVSGLVGSKSNPVANEPESSEKGDSPSPAAGNRRRCYWFATEIPGRGTIRTWPLESVPHSIRTNGCAKIPRIRGPPLLIPGCRDRDPGGPPVKCVGPPLCCFKPPPPRPGGRGSSALSSAERLLRAPICRPLLSFGGELEWLGQRNAGQLSILVRPFVSTANHPPGTVHTGRVGTHVGVGFTDSARRQLCARSSVR
jgi:hypothetical protein